MSQSLSLQQAKHSQCSQLVLIQEMLQALQHCSGPLLELLEELLFAVIKKSLLQVQYNLYPLLKHL